MRAREFDNNALLTTGHALPSRDNSSQVLFSFDEWTTMWITAGGLVSQFVVSHRVRKNELQNHNPRVGGSSSFSAIIALYRVESQFIAEVRKCKGLR